MLKINDKLMILLCYFFLGLWFIFYELWQILYWYIHDKSDFIIWLSLRFIIYFVYYKDNHGLFLRSKNVWYYLLIILTTTLTSKFRNLNRYSWNPSVVAN